MHLLATKPGIISDDPEAIDLQQTPGEVIVISSADTELALFAREYNKNRRILPTLRLANLLQLSHNMSVDLYVEQVIKKAKLVIVRLLGGRNYWKYGVDEITQACTTCNIPVAFLPGDDQPDTELFSFSSLPIEIVQRLWQYNIHGGKRNAENFLKYAGTLIGFSNEWLDPIPIVKSGLYWPGQHITSIEQLRSFWKPNRSIAAFVFYRALVQSDMLTSVDYTIHELKKLKLNPLPIFTQSLKDPIAGGIVEAIISNEKPEVILTTVGFAVSTPGREWNPGPLDSIGCPIIQVGFSSSSEQDWASRTRGLSGRDITMNVALTEIDGRLFSRAVSFKSVAKYDRNTEFNIIRHEPVPDRVRFISELAANWVKLRRVAPEKRRIAIILANYPNKDARLGNGVGLDTPESTLEVLKAMQKAGYKTGKLPKSSSEIIKTLKSGPTNNFKDLKNRQVGIKLSIKVYQAWLSGLSNTTKEKLRNQWGLPENDPYFLEEGFFAIPAYLQGEIAICLQPARGYNIDPIKTFHDPDLIPPHAYLAFYCWLQAEFRTHAIIHMGKHGNLEWLPGKALALSKDCFPEVALGPIPHLYPFIVNDPGEGAQAKRRAQAIIIDHMTPPLTRAESYGPLRHLEQLVDEYYEAAGTHPARTEILRKEILSLCSSSGIDVDCAVNISDTDELALSKIDNYLCELKETQIRDGLHVLGLSPAEEQLTKLIVCLARPQRGDGKGLNSSLHRAMADDLKLDFDPLTCELTDCWAGPKPKVLQDFSQDQWRTNSDTIERLELFANALISRKLKLASEFTRTREVLGWVEQELRPLIIKSGPNEISSLISGLNGEFVQPGPSGAPTRGRPDVLPTGRNFYSVDTRTVPTSAAWTLGWRSTSLLIERYVQDNGEWPKALALSVWGTLNMRTGGEDIAQVLALMGVKPTWDSMNGRVTGFEILPISVLDRPRVDVTLRISGFFRDSFQNLIELVDSATQSIAALEEPESKNPLAARVKKETQILIGQGISAEEAKRSASFRVFGSKPGTYGAGLQALIDEKGWDTEEDLSEAYIAWSGFAYGGGKEGEDAHKLFRERLKTIDVVCHNQDNQEHDLLDSDDYYQFEGGLAASVRMVSGAQPTIYHNDHSTPENPKIRTLEEEIARVVRARVVNPKWISGVMRHGYKGAFEMAATVDYLFAFAATSRCVANHHFDLVFKAYVEDKSVYDFLYDNNDNALGDIVRRLLEAQERGLWSPRSNSAQNTLKRIIDKLSE